MRGAATGRASRRSQSRFSLRDKTRGRSGATTGTVRRRMPDPRSAQHRALGQLIRARREALGISQEDLASAASLDRSHMGAIERGEGNPAYATLLAIADALHVTLSQLQSAVETVAGGADRAP